MEQQFRREHDSVNAPGGSVHRQEVPKVAGHILLHDTPHKGEIKLADTQPDSPMPNGPAFQPVRLPNQEKQGTDVNVLNMPAATHLGAVAAAAEQQPVRTERSAWHTIGLDQEGNVVPTEYGQAFQQELRPEHGLQQPSDITSTAPAVQQPAAPIQPQPSIPPAIQPDDNQLDPNQSTAFDNVEMPTVVPVPKQPIPANPLYSVVPNRSATPPAVPQAEQQQQQLSATPMGGQQHAVHQPTMPMNGAVNPSFATPQMPQDPQLPSGQVAMDHRLPAPKNWLKTILTSPWVWLVAGILMIWYFSQSLFS